MYVHMYIPCWYWFITGFLINSCYFFYYRHTISPRPLDKFDLMTQSMRISSLITWQPRKIQHFATQFCTSTCIHVQSESIIQTNLSLRRLCHMVFLILIGSRTWRHKQWIHTQSHMLLGRGFHNIQFNSTRISCPVKWSPWL